MFEEFIEDRDKGMTPSKTIQELDVSITITTKEIGNQKHLMLMETVGIDCTM